MFVCSIVRIRKGWLILTDEFNLSNRSWSTRCSQEPREIPKLDRSWFRPVTTSNIGLRGESRTIRTWFILRRCSLSPLYRNLFEKGGERRTGRITIQESVAGLQIFSQPRQPIVRQAWGLPRRALQPSLISLQRLVSRNLLDNFCSQTFAICKIYRE